MISITGPRADSFRCKAAMSWFSAPILTFLLFSPAHASLAVPLGSPGVQDQGHPMAVVRGRAVCLDPAGRQVEALFGCDETGRRFGFASKDGRLYKFLPTDG